MASNYPYSEDYKSPYKNNTLKWIVWNVVDAGKGIIEHDMDNIERWIEMQKYYDKERLQAVKDLWNEIYDANKYQWVDFPKEVVGKVGNFITWEAQANLPKWKRVKTSTDSRLPDNLTNVENVAQQIPTVWQQTTAAAWVNQSSQWTQTTNQAPTQTTSQTPRFNSMEEVVYYLAQQPWWANLTEQERLDRVNQLWNAQANITWQTTNEQSSEQQTNNLWEWYTDNVIRSMQTDLNSDTSWTIYWKTSVWWNAINTNQDVNSAFAIGQQDRINKVQDMLQIDPKLVAYSLSWWDNAFSEQTITDVKRFAPEFWNLVQSELKNIQSEDVINAISSWNTLPNTWQTAVNNVNNWVNSWAESISWTPQQTSYTIQNIQNAMNNNMVANNATQLISWLDAQIEEYKSKISNLRNEANSVFKWDVPDYVVNAYINNRTQQYQAEIEKLEWRRQSALDLYKIELSNYQWGVEMDLKYKQFNQDVSNDLRDREYKMQQLNKANVHWENWKAYQVNSDWTITQLTDATAYNSYMNDVNGTISMYKSRYTAWWWTKTPTGYKYWYCGLECEWFTDNFTEMTTGLRMEWADWRSYTYAQEKMDYCNTWTPVVWSVAVWVWWVYDSTFWHTMLVTWWDPNTRMVELLWSNKDWDKTVYSTTDTLDNLYAKGLYGFWDPYQDLIKSSVSNGAYWYNENWVLITPMTAAFDSLIDNSSSWADRESIAAAERAYSTLYEILNDGSLSELITSWDMWKVWNVISKADFANTKDDEWFTFKNMLQNYLETKAAKEFSGWDASMSALRKLIELVETKLRDESWAVINSWEWKSNFRLFIPMPWESEDYMWDKMWDWDNIITKSLRKWWMLKATDYIPLFPKSSKRETW